MVGLVCTVSGCYITSARHYQKVADPWYIMLQFLVHVNVISHVECFVLFLL
jgi:hypothetical protein